MHDNSLKTEVMTPVDDLPELLTTAEVAAIYRVDDSTVERWVRAGTAPESILLAGGQRRFLVDAVKADIEARRAADNSPSGRRRAAA